MADFVTFNKIIPAVNLVEVNALYQRHEDHEYMLDKNIQMEAWSPLAAGKGKLFENPLLISLAQKQQICGTNCFKMVSAKKNCFCS